MTLQFLLLFFHMPCVCPAGGAATVGEKSAGRAEQPARAATATAAQRCYGYRTDVPGESGEGRKSWIKRSHVKFIQCYTTELYFYTILHDKTFIQLCTLF